LFAAGAIDGNISYDYSKDDTLRSLNKDHTSFAWKSSTVYNFISNEVSDQDIDLKFFEYAHAQMHSNATNKALFAGLPIFTGRADTAFHFGMSVLRMEDESNDAHPRPVISSTRIKGAYIKALIPLDNIDAAVNMLNLATSGLYDNMTFTNILYNLLPC